MQDAVHTQYDAEEDVPGPMPHAVLCWVKLGDHRVSEYVSLLPLPFPMLLQQHPLDRHCADRLIKIIIHAHARTDRTRRIHSTYSESDERLRRLYQYLNSGSAAHVHGQLKGAG